nr:hypothetical protein CFP56_08093 [Quercus suber]
MSNDEGMVCADRQADAVVRLSLQCSPFRLTAPKKSVECVWLDGRWRRRCRENNAEHPPQPICRGGPPAPSGLETTIAPDSTATATHESKLPLHPHTPSPPGLCLVFRRNEHACTKATASAPKSVPGSPTTPLSCPLHSGCRDFFAQASLYYSTPYIMRRQTPIALLLHHYLFPNANPSDPPTFSAHLARNLVPEVRIEVSQFYGDLNSAEARYPGLNYAYRPHRLRLGRFKHHRRLFEAFDDLGLTYGEIQEFCCWEGTKWARERYEKDEGITVHDTTANEIGPYVDRRGMKAEDEQRRHSITRKTSISVTVEPATQQIVEENDEEMSDGETETGESAARSHEREENSSGTETASEAAARQSHISALDTRRDHAVQRRRLLAALQQGHALSPEMEQFLKEQSERGDIDLGVGDLRALVNSIRATDRSPISPATSAHIISRAIA